MQYRKDADHAPRGSGQDGYPREGCWSLPAPPVRTNPSLSNCRRILPGIHWPFGAAGRGIAGVCPAPVRGLPQMWAAGAWVPAGTLRELPRRAFGCVQLQTPWLLPDLRGATHGRKCRATGRRSLARTAHAPMGAQVPFSTALSVRQPPSNHGAGAGDRLPRDCEAPDQEGGIDSQDRSHRSGHADPALWQCAVPQHPLSHTVSRRGLC